MLEKFWIIKYLITPSIPFIIFFSTKKNKFIKKKPYVLYLIMAVPTMLVAQLFYFLT